MVLVSHEHEFIFMKTRKTAGSTIEGFLQKYCTPPGTEVLDVQPFTKTKYGIVSARRPNRIDTPPEGFFDSGGERRWPGHMKARHVRKRLEPGYWRRYKKISAVRNPFDRCVSNYFFRMQNNSLKIPDTMPEIVADIRNFLTSPPFSNDRNITHIDGKLIIGHFIRFENLRGDLNSCLEYLGIPPDDSKLPQYKIFRDKQNRPPTAEYFDKRSIEIVKKRMAWVFDIFNYSTDPRDCIAETTVHT
jgi:hypothetical protein